MRSKNLQITHRFYPSPNKYSPKRQPGEFALSNVGSFSGFVCGNNVMRFVVNLPFSCKPRGFFLKSEVSLLMNVLRLSISTYIVSNTQ